MLHKKKFLVLSMCIGVAIGSLLMWVLNRPSVPSDWFAVDLNSGTSMSTKVIESDLPLADVTSLQGKARFIDHESASSGDVGIGYFFNIELSQVDPKKIPEKYSKPKVIPGSKLSESEVTNPNYVIQFNLTLRDKDGFTVAEVRGLEHIVDAGKVNKITGQTKHDFPRQKAALVRSVDVGTYFKSIPSTRE